MGDLLTQEGCEKLQEELNNLVNVKRREIAKKIKAARNSRYKWKTLSMMMLNEQAFIEGRIKEIENMLRVARIVTDDEITGKTVSLGTTVKLRDLETGEEFSYTIVGSVESDPLNFKISNESPIGKAILGHKRVKS